MRQRRRILIGAATVLLAAAVLTAAGAFGRRPFRALSPGDIVSADVRLIPPDVTVALDGAQTETLAALLQEAVIYRRDDSYVEYDGQGVIFTLRFSDGTRQSVMAYSPFLVLDDVGYRTAYGPCQALNAFANDLLYDHQP